MNILIPGRDRKYVDGDTFDFSGPLAFTIDGVMSADACAAMIARIDAGNPTVAPVSTARGFVMMPDVRNNERVILDDAPLVRSLYESIEAALPTRLFDKRPVGANERLRCYRYRPGQQFAMHRDGAFARDEHERSELTFMVYLNDGFGGGDTVFHEYGVSATPRAGMALLFQHMLLHEGSVVTSGTKYVLRSDVMFAP